MTSIAGQLVEAFQRIQQLEHRTARMFRPATVAEVDNAKQRVRVHLDEPEANRVLSPWLPHAQFAAPDNGLKAHTPMKQGQAVSLLAAAGELRQAVVLPFTWSDAAPSPGSEDHPVLTFGQWKVEAKGDSIKASFGGSSLELTPSAFEVNVNGASIKLDADAFRMIAKLVKAEGESLKHNEKDVGDTHKHTEVMPGPALTGPPA